MTTTAVTAVGARAGFALDRVAFWLLLAFVASLQLSIAAAGILLTAALLAWAALLLRDRVVPSAPTFMVPLVAYAGATLVSAAFSLDPWASFIDSKQLVLLLIVPMVYHVARGRQASMVIDTILAVGAVSAAYGIVQYGMLHYDSLRLRPDGALTHYMTYSGTLMLVLCAAVARLVFGSRDRVWPALVMPALVVALAVSLGRNAWVGACVAVGLLLAMRDFRLVALLPVGHCAGHRTGARQRHEPDDVDVRPAGSDEPGPDCHARSRRRYGARSPADRRRPHDGAERLPTIPASRRGEAAQPASPQRAGPDCRGARAPGPRHLGVVHRRSRWCR